MKWDFRLSPCACACRCSRGSGAVLLRPEFSSPVWRVSVHASATRIHFCHTSWYQGAVQDTGECVYSHAKTYLSMGGEHLCCLLKHSWTHRSPLQNVKEIINSIIVTKFDHRFTLSCASEFLCLCFYVFSCTSWFWSCSCCVVVSARVLLLYVCACLHVYPQGSVCEDWTTVYCCYPLAVCQMIREMKRRMKTQTYHVSTALECSWRNSRQ